MQTETTFLWALAITFAASVAVVICLWRQLYRMLVDVCRFESRGRFWAVYFVVFIILTPPVAIMFTHTGDSMSFLFVVMHQIKWGLLGLLVAMLFVGFCTLVITQTRSSTLHVRPDQVGELERLLSKMEVIRARNILRRQPEDGEVDEHFMESEF